MKDDLIKKKDLIVEIEINSIDEIYNKVLYSKDYDGYIFRGHGDASYLLKPSLLRDDLSVKYGKQEKLCLEELKSFILFFREANNHGLYVPAVPEFYMNYLSNFLGIEDILRNDIYYWLPDNIMELAILAQHYGVKTRLLDWTRDIKVALYFACEDIKAEKDGECAIWCVDAKWLQEYKRRHILADEVFSTGVANNHPDNHDEKRRLIRMIKDDSIPIRFIVSPYDNNANLNAQKGILSIWQHNIVQHKESIPIDLIEMRNRMSDYVERFFDSDITVDNKPLDELLLYYFNASKNRVSGFKERGRQLFTVFKFSNRLKCEFLEILRKEGYDKAYIYPGYRSIADMVNEQIAIIT